MTIKIERKVSYSQNNEEAVILRKLSGMSPGVVLDIGAHDGKTNSNSLALIEMGWRGFLVEPSPVAFAKLLELHGKNEKVQLINAAVGTEERLTKFYDFGGDQYGTTLEATALRRSNSNSKPLFATYWVPQITIRKLVEQIGVSADVLSVDCEGASVDILFSCPIGSWSPSVIVVEHDGRAVEISGWAREKGFEVGSLNAENVILMRS